MRTVRIRDSSQHARCPPPRTGFHACLRCCTLRMAVSTEPRNAFPHRAAGSGLTTTVRARPCLTCREVPENCVAVLGRALIPPCHRSGLGTPEARSSALTLLTLMPSSGSVTAASAPGSEAMGPPTDVSRSLRAMRSPSATCGNSSSTALPAALSARSMSLAALTSMAVRWSMSSRRVDTVSPGPRGAGDANSSGCGRDSLSAAGVELLPPGSAPSREPAPELRVAPELVRDDGLSGDGD